MLRLIVDDPDKAFKSLKDAGLIVRTTSVLAISIDDVAGSLASALDTIDKCGISVEYMYAYLGYLSGKAMVVLKVNEPEEATERLRSTNVNVLSAEDVYKNLVRVLDLEINKFYKKILTISVTRC
ncbi:MAG: hypothetical protein L6V93_07365 [Clostridiales bacterium]|nr:MAG: hypothetical protein L6V93_07365 [Clostridiales bacterium]